MKSRLFSLLAFLFGLFGTMPAAHAYFHYQFTFDATGSYSAASFEFDSPSLLLNIGDSAAVSPTGDLNGYTVSQIRVNQREPGPGNIAFGPTSEPSGSSFGTAAGDVIYYFFAVGGYGGGVGTFISPGFAGRDISHGDGLGSSYLDTTGTMTISERNVPEPASSALVSLALAALCLCAAFRVRQT